MAQHRVRWFAPRAIAAGCAATASRATRTHARSRMGARLASSPLRAQAARWSPNWSTRALQPGSLVRRMHRDAANGSGKRRRLLRSNGRGCVPFRLWERPATTRWHARPPRSTAEHGNSATSCRGGARDRKCLVHEMPAFANHEAKLRALKAPAARVPAAPREAGNPTRSVQPIPRRAACPLQTRLPAGKGQPTHFQKRARGRGAAACCIRASLQHDRERARPSCPVSRWRESLHTGYSTRPPAALGRKATWRAASGERAGTVEQKQLRTVQIRQFPQLAQQAVFVVESGC